MKKYIKPAFQVVDIILNDLCAGSKCTTIDVNIIPIKKQKDKTYLLHRGDTKNMWDTNF